MSTKFKPPLQRSCLQHHETAPQASYSQYHPSREMENPETLIRRYLNQNDEYLWKRIKNVLAQKTILHISKYSISNKQKIQDAVYEVMKEVIGKIKIGNREFTGEAEQVMKYKKQIKNMIKNKEELQNRIKRREDKIEKMENTMRQFYKFMCTNRISKQALHKQSAHQNSVAAHHQAYGELKSKHKSVSKFIKNIETTKVLSDIIPIVEKYQKQALSFSVRLVSSSLSQHLGEKSQIQKDKLAILQLRKQMQNKNKQIEEMASRQSIKDKEIQDMRKRQKVLMIRYAEIIERMYLGFQKQKNELSKMNMDKQTALKFSIKQLTNQIQSKDKQIADLSNKYQQKLQIHQLLSSQSNQTQIQTSSVPFNKNQQTQTITNSNCSIYSQILHISTLPIHMSQQHIQTQTSDIQSVSDQSEYVYEFDIGTQYDKLQQIQQGTQYDNQQNQQKIKQRMQKQQSQFLLQPTLESLQQLKILRINHSNTLQQLQSLRHKFITYMEENEYESESKINQLEQCLKNKQSQIELLNKNNSELLQTIQYANSLFTNSPIKQDMPTMFPFYHRNTMTNHSKFINTNTESTNSQKSSEETQFIFSRFHHNNCLDEAQTYIECSEDEGEIQAITSKSIDKSAVSRLLAEFVNLQNKQQDKINAFVTLIGMLDPAEKQEKKISGFLQKKKSRMAFIERGTGESRKEEKEEKLQLKDKLYQFFTDI